MRSVTAFSNQLALGTSLALIALATWWLGMLSVQSMHGFADLPVISKQAVGVLLLTQWLIIGLLAPSAALSDRPLKNGQAAVAAFAPLPVLIVPFWPLLVLCWMSTDLATVPLLMSQAAALILAVVLIALFHRLSRHVTEQASRVLFGNAFGALVAALLWSQRTLLHTWFIE